MRRFALALALLPGLALADVHYSLAPDLPAQSIRITVRLDEANEKEEFRIPAWCPGYYQILDYQSKISDVRATDLTGAELRTTNPDSRGWVVQNPAKTPITFSYRVLGDDPGLGFFWVNVRPHTVFVNGPAALMYVEGRKQEKCFLDFTLPSDWDIATAMKEQDDGRYACGDYDELIDHPLQLGKFQRRKFTVEGIPFEAVYVSPNSSFRPDLDAETQRLQAVSRPAIKMFGKAPFESYLYIIHLSVGDFHGGLEHRASTVLAVPNTRPLEIDDLAAHELFHAWNVKQIRFKELGPFDYANKVRTRSLWWLEGVTDYYAKLHTYQSGLQDKQWLLASLGREIFTLQRSKVRSQKSVEHVGLNAWETGGFGDGDLSFYNKGLVVGLLFDAAIRTQTQGRKSLDDVMRLLFERHRLPKAGFAEGDILETINEVAGSDMSGLYRSMVQSTEELPYHLLEGIGLQYDRARLVERPVDEASQQRLVEFLSR